MVITALPQGNVYHQVAIVVAHHSQVQAVLPQMRCVESNLTFAIKDTLTATGKTLAMLVVLQEPVLQQEATLAIVSNQVTVSLGTVVATAKIWVVVVRVMVHVNQLVEVSVTVLNGATEALQTPTTVVM